jgi:uncharacterized protein (UPF0276 family)
MPRFGSPRTFQGTGVGLRGPHVPQILRERPPVPWFELLTDNHLAAGGALRFQAEAISELYPVTLHGVGMSLGGVDPLDWVYLDRVRDLAQRTRARAVSEHLAFTGHAGVHSHDLLPLPWTGEALLHVAGRIRRIQEFLGSRILIENISAYIEYRDTELTEGEFLTELCNAADCGLLLDINNVYVNSVNNDRDPMQLLDAIPWQRVEEIHLAGHDARGDLLIDTHGSCVCDEVIELFEGVIDRAPLTPVLLEWDTNLPDWSVLWTEAQRIEATRLQALSRQVA